MNPRDRYGEAANNPDELDTIEDLDEYTDEIARYWFATMRTQLRTMAQDDDTTPAA